MRAPITARDISAQHDSKPLGKFGCKSVERAPGESDRSRIYSALILDLAGQLPGGKA